MITNSNPFAGSGCPIKCTAFYFTPCPVPSCPAYEPNSNDGEYSQPFRHIQHNRIASRVPSLPWQCFCVDASPGESTDVSILMNGSAAARAASTNKKRNKELPCLLTCPSRCLPALKPHRNHPHVGADLLAGVETASEFR